MYFSSCKLLFSIKQKHIVAVVLSVVFFLSYIGSSTLLFSQTSHTDPIRTMKRVLVLNSYHPGYVWGDSVNEGIRRVFDSSDLMVNIRYEFMDTKHLRPEVIFERLREIYLVKYSLFQFDVVIATDNNALNFLLQYRDELFPDTPVVFCGINGFKDEMLQGATDFTGFAENSDFRGTVDIALKIHPDTENIAYVSGTSTSSLINQLRMKEIIPFYQDKYKMIDLSRLNPEQLKEKLRKLPEKTIIIYLSYYKMEDGTFLTVQESTSLVFNNAGLPMYSPWEYTMGYGIVGGMMLSGSKEGERAAYYALKLLSGTPISELPVVKQSQIEPIFDHKMLDVHHIRRETLPTDSHIINEPQTLYYKYKYYIWALIIFVCYQTATILWLSHNLMRRKRAEKLQKQLETQLLHSQKMEAIGTFAGGIAHDLNNILGAIGTCSELALEDTPESNPAREDLKHVLNATERGKALIRQILDFSRKRELEKKQIDMREMILECTTLLKQVVPPTIETKLEPLEGNCYVFANPAKIHQIIMNLCTNAEQAMRGKSGTLRLGLQKLDSEAKELAKLMDISPGEYVCLTVQDSGCGMSKELMTRIFEPFYTTRSQTEGTGLGLAVVHGIIKGYGGTVTVASTLGQGSTLSVYLPAVPKDDLGETVHRAPDHLPKGNETILLVDDDPDVLYSATKLLEQSGYTVFSANNPTAGIDEFIKRKKEIDLLLTDHVMPQMTGIELSKKIREISTNLPIILTSGHTDLGFTQESLSEDKIQGFVQKPFTSFELINTIQEVLRKTQILNGAEEL